MARANDFICGLSGTTGAAKKEPAWSASGSRPTMLDLHGLSPAKRPATSEDTREAEQLWQLARQLNSPPEMITNAYDFFSRHASAPEATPTVPCPSLLQEGRLSKEQFRKVVHDLLDCVSEDTADVLVNEAFRDADRDGSNEIDFGEFAIWISSRGFSEVVNLTAEQIDMRDLARKHGMAHAEVEQYKKSFDKFDTDGSGFISRDEFEAILSKCARLPQGTGLPQQKVQTLWRLADSDGSHALDFQEFLVFYRRYFDGNGFESMYRFRRRLTNF